MANIIGIPQEIRSIGFREFVYKEKGVTNQGDGSGCTWNHFGNITNPTGFLCGWTTAAVNNYITFTTQEKELDLYAFMSWQYSSSYNVSVSVEGATVIQNDCVTQTKDMYHLKLTNITGTVKIIIYTSYSAVGGIGYIIL